MSYTGNKTMIDLTNKFKFYQDIRLWPKNSDFNYEAWLDNFDAGEERNLAQCILDFFIFFPDDIIDQLVCFDISLVETYFPAFKN